MDMEMDKQLGSQKTIQEENTQPEVRKALKLAQADYTDGWITHPETAPSYKAMMKIANQKAKMLSLTVTKEENIMWARKCLSDNFAIISEIKQGKHDLQIVTDTSGETIITWLEEGTEKDPHTKIFKGATLFLRRVAMHVYKKEEATYEQDEDAHVNRMLLIGKKSIVFAQTHNDGIEYIKEKEDLARKYK
eukprot:scaffold30483_cov52-Attheya_sp.AAC.2